MALKAPASPRSSRPRRGAEMVRGERPLVVYERLRHLIVHGVLARAMNGAVANTTLAELDADLAYALHLHVGRSALEART